MRPEKTFFQEIFVQM